MENTKEGGLPLRAIAVVVVGLVEVDGLERKLETPPPELEDHILKAAADALVSLRAQAPAARLEMKRLEEK